jgi:hypothetical protein
LPLVRERGSKSFRRGRTQVVYTEAGMVIGSLLFLRSLALLVRLKNPASQIVSVRFSHALVFAGIAKKSLGAKSTLAY